MEIKYLQIFVKWEGDTILEWSLIKNKTCNDLTTPFIVVDTGQNYWRNGDEKNIVACFDCPEKAHDYIDNNLSHILRVFDCDDLKKGAIWRNEDLFAEIETIIDGVKLIFWINFDDSGAAMNAVYVAGSNINIIKLLNNNTINSLNKLKNRYYERNYKI